MRLSSNFELNAGVTSVCHRRPAAPAIAPATRISRFGRRRPPKKWEGTQIPIGRGLGPNRNLRPTVLERYTGSVAELNEILRIDIAVAVKVKGRVVTRTGTRVAERVAEGQEI